MFMIWCKKRAFVDFWLIVFVKEDPARDRKKGAIRCADSETDHLEIARLRRDLSVDSTFVTLDIILNVNSSAQSSNRRS